MPNHTPEPWAADRTHPMQLVNQIKRVAGSIVVYVLSEDDYFHAVCCVNGSAGLTPTAYRACVEALESALFWQDPKNGLSIMGGEPTWVEQAKHALAQAVQP